MIYLKIIEFKIQKETDQMIKILIHYLLELLKYYKLPTRGIDWAQENHMVPNRLLFESIMGHWRLDPLVPLLNSIMLHLFTLFSRYTFQSVD